MVFFYSTDTTIYTLGLLDLYVSTRTHHILVGQLELKFMTSLLTP